MLEPETSSRHYLLDLKAQIEAGTSPYGDPSSAEAQAKLADLAAHIEVARRVGDIEPEDSRSPVERAAQARFEREMPHASLASEVSDPFNAVIEAKLNALDAINETDPRKFGALARA